MEMRSLPGRLALAAFLAFSGVSCASRAGGTEPTSASAPTSPATGAAAPAPDVQEAARRPYTEADVRFMQGMIVHHAQAIVMTDMVESRTESRDIRLLAKRIALSQVDEMAMMRSWLETRGEEVPEVDGAHGGHGAHGAHGHELMPGMLTDEELANLAAARGEEFDRLFLEYMIRHHEGALKMVADLFASPGAAQDPEIDQFASHVDADQRMEIARMRSMLAARR
ncbi:MAG TPA: DUF305 domain-containing protein [Longimicrobiales bacterium]|nr:DUF305 domain-containing protein [Longimicrobiales bacterium]